MELNEAIKHCHEKAEEIRKANEEMPTDCKLSEDLCECAREHEQLASWLTELQERRDADKKLKEILEEMSGRLKDSLFGDGIRFALKVIEKSRKREQESEAENE